MRLHAEREAYDMAAPTLLKRLPPLQQLARGTAVDRGAARWVQILGERPSHPPIAEILAILRQTSRKAARFFLAIATGQLVTHR